MLGEILFVVLIVVMLLLAPTCAAIYIYYTRTRMTTEEWAKQVVEDEKRLKDEHKYHYPFYM